MYNDFNSIFDNFLDVFNNTSSTRIPSVDIKENAEDYFIEMEVPGYDKTDVDLRIDNHSITIKTTDAFNEKVESNKEKLEYLISETNLNKVFKRSFSLPKDVDETKINAKFSNGVLEIRIPKLKKNQAKIIKILDR